MSNIESIHSRISENSSLKNGWMMIEPMCNDHRIVLSGHTADAVYRARIIQKEEGKLVVECTEGDYGRYGYVDGQLVIQEGADSVEEAIEAVLSVSNKIDVDEPPFSFKRTLDILVDAGAVLITVEPQLLNTGLLVVPHISDCREEFVQLGRELGKVKIDDTIVRLDLVPSLDLSPTLGNIVAYSGFESRAGGIRRMSTEIGAEKAEEEVSLKNWK